MASGDEPMSLINTASLATSSGLCAKSAHTSRSTFETFDKPFPEATCRRFCSLKATPSGFRNEATRCSRGWISKDRSSSESAMTRGSLPPGMLLPESRYRAKAKIVSSRVQFGLPCPFVAAISFPAGRYRRPSSVLTLGFRGHIVELDSTTAPSPVNLLPGSSLETMGRVLA